MFKNSVFRVWFLCLLGSFATVPVVFAQQEVDCTVVYNKFVAERTGPDIPKYKTALASGKQYLDKCGSDPDQELQKRFVEKQIARITEVVKGLELVERFNAAGIADRKDELVTVGKELVAVNHPASLDVAIVIASIGYEKAIATPPVDTLNEDTIRYAKMALEKIGSGAKSDKYGAFKYHYAVKQCTDGAVNASGWMNYTIGYVMAARQKMAKAAIPYYYKAAQTGCETKNIPEIYRFIAAAYLDEGIAIEKKINEKLAAAQNQETDETKALDALLNGYLDRAIDAYARAYKAATANATTPPDTKDTYYKKLKELYTSRFDGKTDGLDQVVDKVISSPFADPATEVKPVPAVVATPSSTPTKPN